MANDSTETHEGTTEKLSFTKELELLINKHSQESASNTPDFILAQYIDGCLTNFAAAVQQRETWHGRDPRPSKTRYGVAMPD